MKYLELKGNQSSGSIESGEGGWLMVVAAGDGKDSQLGRHRWKPDWLR